MIYRERHIDLVGSSCY